MRKKDIWLIKLIVLSLIASSVATAQTARRSDSFGDSEYRLGPEDIVEISVWKEPELTGDVIVRPDGKITVQLIGEIVASGKTAPQLAEEITSKLKPFFETEPPRVNVIVREINSPKVSVFGEVRRPDVYPIKQKTTVLDAVALAGGTTEFAKTNRIVVIREGPAGPHTFKLSIDSIIRGGTESTFYLQPGDTVYVP